MNATLDGQPQSLDPKKQIQAVEFLSLAIRIARSLSWDDESEGVALLALCKAISRHRNSEVDLKAYLSMRIRQAVKRARARAARFVTNLELEAMPAPAPSDKVELPSPLAEVAQLRYVEKLPRRMVARKLGIPRRLVAEREEAIRRFLTK